MSQGGYSLIIGEKNYSSWSMRAWLLLRFLGASFDLIDVNLYRPESRAAVQALGGETGLAPVLKHGDLTIWDTLAIVEYLAERHEGVWPQAPGSRARARAYAGEVHSGFQALREAMPFNVRARGRLAPRTPEVVADIARVQRIWEQAEGPWLFGAFGVTDILFAPVATRFQTYGVSLSGAAEQYRERLLRHPLVQEWMALGAAEAGTIPRLERPFAEGPTA